jgi:hypothetical protein
MRRVIVHAGWPKTATTTLQFQLRAAWPNLAGRPWSRPGGDASRTVLHDVTRGNSDGATIDALFESSWRDRTLPVFLSHEGLVGMRKWQHGRDRLDPLAIPGHLSATSWPVHVVFTLREPRSLLRSNYRYAVRDGYSRTYLDFLDEERVALQTGHGPLSIRGVIEAWEHAFGRSAISIAWMDVLVADPVSFWNDLAAFTGVAELARVAAVPIEHRNRTMLGPLRWELAVNRVLAPKSDRRRGRYTARARRVHNRLVADRLGRDRPDELDGGALEREIVDQMSADVEWLTERYRPRPRA